MSRLLPFILLILVILGIAIAVPMALASHRYKPRLEAELSRKFERPVLIGRMKVGLFPPTLRLDGLTIARSESDRRTFFQAETANVRLAWRSLARMRPVPLLVTLSAPRCILERQPGGSWGTGAWWDGARRSLTAKDSPHPSVEIRNGALEFLDPWMEEDAGFIIQNISAMLEADVRSLRGRGELQGLSAPVTLQFEPDGFSLREGGRLLSVRRRREPGKTVWEGGAKEWRWDLLWPLARFAARLPGTLRASTAPAMLADLTLEAGHTGAAWTLRHSGALAGGISESEWTWAPGPGGGSLRGTAAIRAVPAAAIPEVDGLLRNLSGGVSGLAEFEIETSSAGRALKAAQATLEIEDGRYSFPPIALKSIKKAKTLAYFRKKFPNFDRAGLPFRRVRIVGSAGGPLFKLDEARLESGDLRAAAAGHLDLAKTGFDLTVRLDLRESEPALRRLIPGRYIAGTGRNVKILPIYGRLQGRPSEFHIKAVPAANVPRSPTGPRASGAARR